MVKKDTILNDTVHNHIEVPGLCMSIMNTLQFDRLRSIKQLGVVHYVFPCAQHTRWEHSVGVMHLAGQLVDHLRKKRPGCCDDKDKLCVMIAGLCHDLGHGPLSHFWEDFVREARPGTVWNHERTSIEMLDYLIEDNDLEPEFRKHGLDQLDILFIKEMIYGPLWDDSSVCLQQYMVNGKIPEYGYIGRSKDKHFLYEIVANKTSSFDVDKWDYIIRDSKALNISNSFDLNRLLSFVNIVDHDGLRRLAIRDKEADTLKEMFQDRGRLHRKSFKHRVVKILDRMVMDAFLSADKHLNIVNGAKGFVRISEACDDVRNLVQLTDDYLLSSIKHSRDPKLAEAREILLRITRRKLYRTIGCVSYPGGCSPGKISDLQNSLNDKLSTLPHIQPQDVVLELVKINLGLGNKNPVKKCIFFNKEGKAVPFTEDLIQEKLPENAIHETVQVICRKGSHEAGHEDDSLFAQMQDVVRDWALDHFNTISNVKISIT